MKLKLLILMLTFLSFAQAEEQKVYTIKKGGIPWTKLPPQVYQPQQPPAQQSAYQWESFEDVEILRASDPQQGYVLFGLRKGTIPNPTAPNLRKQVTGFWHGYSDLPGNWYSKGTTFELNQYIKQHLDRTISPHATITAHAMTACKDKTSGFHIFIKVTYPVTGGYQDKLLYVLWRNPGSWSTKLSSPLSDNMGGELTCVADDARNVHLFGFQNWSSSSHYSKIAHYKITVDEQNTFGSTFNFQRTLLPDSFETNLFAVYPSVNAIDLVFAKRGSTNLSVSRKIFQQRELANLAAGWNMIYNDNVSPAGYQTSHLDGMVGFAAGFYHYAHLIGFKRGQVTGTPQGVFYTYQNDQGTWKSDGLVLPVGLKSLSASTSGAPAFVVAGTTYAGDIWHGYYKPSTKQWVNKGIIFSRTSQ